MKAGQRKNSVKPQGLVTKSVSMPGDLFVRANLKVQSDEELDWSKYVRRLIRKDLEVAA
jgi:hypothetical protein